MLCKTSSYLFIFSIYMPFSSQNHVQKQPKRQRHPSYYKSKSKRDLKPNNTTKEANSINQPVRETDEGLTETEIQIEEEVTKRVLTFLMVRGFITIASIANSFSYN